MPLEAEPGRGAPRPPPTGASRTLYCYRARYYDPSLGRFISEDPIRFLGGNNFYSYVGNNSVNRLDPFGLQACCSNGQPSGFWFCYERCVNKFLINPAVFAAGMVTTSFINTLGSATSGVGQLTNAQFTGAVAGGWVGSNLFQVPVSQLVPWINAGKATGAASTSVARFVTAAAATYGSGVVLGCALACDINSCGY